MERVRLKIRKKEAVASFQALLVESIKDPQVYLLGHDYGVSFGKMKQEKREGNGLRNMEPGMSISLL